MTKVPPVLLIADGHVDLPNRRVVRGETVVHLTPTEQALLERLAAAEGALVDGDTLLQEAWGYAPGVKSRAVYTAIQRLRTKLERDPSAPQHLLSVYGGGYRFVPRTARPVQADVALPPESCPFFGRADLLARLRVALEQPGLITLHGPGGMGKSRMALRCAHHLAEGAAWPPGGATLVDVEATANPDLLLDAVCTALQVPWPASFDRAQAQRHLVERLADRPRWVLILDGVERLVEAVRELCEGLLGALSRLTILVTSRLPLAVEGEQLHALAPLQAEAGLALFLDRASRVRWGFSPTEDQRSRLSELVMQPLAGMPLAIELAAARVGVLSVQDLCEGLGLRGLRDTRRHGPSHHSLDAALAWSFDMLDEAETRALAWLACFQGSPDLDDIRAVLGEGFAEDDIVDLLQRLVDAALVSVNHTPAGTRYRLLTPIRERAVRLLDAASPAKAAWFAHVCRASDTLAETIRDPEEPASRARLPWLRPDLVAALSDGIAAGHALTGRLCLAMDRLTETVDPFGPRLERLAGALGVEREPGVQVALLAARVRILHSLHDWEQAEAALVQMEALAAAPEDQARYRASLGRHRMLTGALEEAIALLEGPEGDGYGLLRLGYCHQARGEHTLARAHYERALQRFEASGDGLGAAMVLGNLSLTVGELGELDRSHTLAEGMLAIAQQLDHGPLQTSAQQLLGTYSLRACRFSEAARWLEEAGRLAHHFGDADRAYLIDLNRAEIRWEEGDLAGARELLDACLERELAASARLFAQVLRGALAHEEGELAQAEALLAEAWTTAGALGLADRQVFAGLCLAPLLAEQDLPEEAQSVLTTVTQLVEEMQDEEGRVLVGLHRLHLQLAVLRASGEDGLRREVVRGLRRLPPPEGLLLRRAQRLLRRVAERSGVR